VCTIATEVGGAPRTPSAYQSCTTVPISAASYTATPAGVSAIPVTPARARYSETTGPTYAKPGSWSVTSTTNTTGAAAIEQ
jgi:hypothetical protein